MDEVKKTDGQKTEIKMDGRKKEDGKKKEDRGMEGRKKKYGRRKKWIERRQIGEEGRWKEKEERK